MAERINYITTRVRHFMELPDLALLSAKEIMFLTGRSRTSIWRDVKRHLLPKPISVGPNAVRWKVKDIRDYMNGKMVRYNEQ